VSRLKGNEMHGLAELYIDKNKQPRGTTGQSIPKRSSSVIKSYDDGTRAEAAALRSSSELYRNKRDTPITQLKEGGKGVQDLSASYNNMRDRNRRGLLGDNSSKKKVLII
jgi:hypothetical protein